ncbi:Stress response regulator protein 1 [Candida viswanathii]|uniref:Stress response regulator protein 1 n=1 Tax=Candida viswanathii TaxID=5486 RepID=A0A367Y8Z7_9ASCO|nr:Stress response regulator protein 1 [Candida viswanathii]
MNFIMCRNNLSHSSLPQLGSSANNNDNTITNTNNVDYFSLKPKLSLDTNSPYNSDSQANYSDYDNDNDDDDDDDYYNRDTHDELLDPFDTMADMEYYSPLTPFEIQTNSPQDSIISSKSSNKSTSLQPFPLTLPNLTNYHFLIVDDNLINLKILNRVLLKLYPRSNIVQVQDSKLVTEILQRQHFDLVFLDIEMPDISGIDIAKFIRADEKLKQMPVIAVTTRNSADDLQLYKECGIDHTFHKPLNYSLDLMGTAIDGIIERRNSI